MFLLGISENKATRKEFAIYRSNVVVPTGPGFFSLKTFCFAKMTSRVFNIVLEGSFQRSCCAKLLSLKGQKILCLWNNIAEKTEFPEAYYFQKFHAKYNFFILRKGFSKLSLGEKLIPEILEKKLEKKTCFPTWLWSDFGK